MPEVIYGFESEPSKKGEVFSNPLLFGLYPAFYSPLLFEITDATEDTSSQSTILSVRPCISSHWKLMRRYDNFQRGLRLNPNGKCYGYRPLVCFLNLFGE